jgi:hypothetical protein
MALIVLPLLLTGCALKWSDTRLDRRDAVADVPLDVADEADVVLDVDEDEQEDAPLDVPDDIDEEDVEEDAEDALDAAEEDVPLTFDPIPVVSGELCAYLDGLGIPSTSGVVRDITPSRRTRWQTLATSLLDGDWAAAWSEASLLNVDLTVVSDTVSGSPYVVASQLNRGEAVLVVAPTWDRTLLVEVPYPLSASGTLCEGATILRSAGGRVLLVAGGGRCTATWYSTCDGTTVSCEGTESSYYTSDVAHYTNLAYQVLHDHLMGSDVAMKAVQLQDMTDASGAGAVVSDGTTIPDTSTPSISVDMRNALQTHFPVTTAPIYSCNDPSDTGYSSSCNVDNIQGRSTNGSSDPCTVAASSSSNRFVVMELSAQLRDPSRFADMAAAVADAF